MRSTLLAATLALTLPGMAFAQRVMAPLRSGSYSMEVLDEEGHVLPTYMRGGKMYTLGTHGQRYLLRIRNGSPRRVEAVASVDGRDVIDGRPSAVEKRGYIVPPYGEITIDGYRTSDDSVAAFRFSSVADSYASRWGDSRDVGVVGVAIFSERQIAIPYYRPPVYRPAPEYPYSGARKAPSAPSANSPAPAPAQEPGALAQRGESDAERPGLGTEYGEEHFSQVIQVNFERASSRPDAVLSLHYNDAEGLRALGIDVDGRFLNASDDLWLRETAHPFRRDYSEAPPVVLREW